ncbi:Transcription factor lbx1 [Mactra antiquata]
MITQKTYKDKWTSFPHHCYRFYDSVCKLEESRRHRDEDQQNKSQIPKKKRKTRTAFTNQQIYELEKRFILQKYLTPSDRDEIAGKLGLSCAQVITWFQNRRAKFKRDIEEMKHDVVTSSPKKSETENETK